MKNFRKIVVCLFAVLLSLIGCKQDESGFVGGEVMITLQDNASFYDAYTLIDSLKIKIIELHDFDYVIKKSPDSVEVIKQILRSKPYLTNGVLTSGMLYKSDSLFISANFFDVDSIDASDWLYTVEQLNLIEKQHLKSFKFGILGVTIGQEQSWVSILTKYPIITSASVNHIIHE